MKDYAWQFLRPFRMSNINLAEIADNKKLSEYEWLQGETTHGGFFHGRNFNWKDKKISNKRRNLKLY